MKSPIEVLKALASRLFGPSNGPSESTGVEDTERGRVSPGNSFGKRAPGFGANNPLYPNVDVNSVFDFSKKAIGGRLTQDLEGNFFGNIKVVLPPGDPETNWRLGSLDEQTLNRIPTNKLIELLADLSPEVSRAVWDFLRFANPGYEIIAYRKTPMNPDARAQKACDDFIDLLDNQYGSFDVVLGRLFFAAFLRGAFLAELVFGADARTPIDLATPDPGSVRFIRIIDPLRGPIHVLAQYQGGGLVVLDRPTIRYTAIDPFPGSPYGRPLVSPAVYSTLFLLGLLHDLRRVISQQGYPRLDISIDLEAIRAMMPQGADSDPQLLQDWVTATIAEIQTFYAKLQPEDAFVHTNAIEMHPPQGVMDSKSLSGAKDLINFVERMAIRALKTMPLLMGVTEGVSEANANRQWEIHVAGVKALQHYAETSLETLFQLMLQAQGIPGKVRFRFAELRAAELLRDAQTETLVIGNEMQKYLNGWTNQNEGANRVTGHDADQKEPRLYPTTEAFKGAMMPAASAGAGKATSEPAANQPNANPTTAEQGGNKQPKPKTDPKKQNADAATKGSGQKALTEEEERAYEEEEREVDAQRDADALTLANPPFAPQKIRLIVAPAFEEQFKSVLAQLNGVEKN